MRGMIHSHAHRNDPNRYYAVRGSYKAAYTRSRLASNRELAQIDALQRALKQATADSVAEREREQTALAEAEANVARARKAYANARYFEGRAIEADTCALEALLESDAQLDRDDAPLLHALVFLALCALLAVLVL